MDRDTEATLHRKNTRTESDKMTTNGRIEDLVRQFMILPKETRREYSIGIRISRNRKSGAGIWYRGELNAKI
jgi:hypothetical protein